MNPTLKKKNSCMLRALVAGIVVNIFILGFLEVLLFSEFTARAIELKALLLWLPWSQVW